MTKDDYLRIAREAGFKLITRDGAATKEQHRVLALCHTIAALEREECAKVCDELAKDGGYCDGPGPKSCAAAIRNKDTK
jgi:hypothetical protein